MMKFIMAVECPNCGAVVKDDGMTVDYTADEGIVCLNLFSQQQFHCDDCDTDIYTGDMEDALEYNSPDEEEDYDDD